MSGYVEWFRIAVEHAYYTGSGSGQRRPRLVPTRATRALLDRLGARMRSEADALVVVLPSARLADLEGTAGAMDAAPLLSFTASFDDPHVAIGTLPQARPGQILCADSRHAVAESDGTWRLHEGDCLGAEALVDGTEAGQPAWPGAPGAHLLVRIAAQAAAGTTPAAARRYVVRLDAASTYWKYYLLDALAARALAIVDVDERVAFRRTGEGWLAGRAAAVFLSDRAIALRDRPAERFQLREQGAFGDKIFMKRLPVACAGIRQRTVVDGHVVLVSEIFVND